jgi:hypothetical protein
MSGSALCREQLPKEGAAAVGQGAADGQAGEPIPADGPQLGKALQMARLVNLFRQMARSWARRCRWPGW